jgi:hypothetical protein
MPVKRLIGPSGRLYADPKPSRDETTFRQPNNSAAYYQSPYYLAHKDQVQAIPPSRHPRYISLEDFVPEVTNAITKAGKINFHAVGDTGAAKVNRTQSVATALAHQAAVADAMAKEVDTGGLTGPAFFFHLGDCIYNFGEAQYYYDQFYEPYREYDRPIFAVPGNHDGVVFGSSSSAPQVPSLTAFLRNFCAEAPGPSPDAGGIMRSVMTQPGVYFTLDAPFVSIIGLYTNVLEGPGVLSSQNGKFPTVGDDQINFLTEELQRLKPERDAGTRAVLLAFHHPPLSADALHGGSTGPLDDIDRCCKEAGLWPDAILSGHAHLYQRFTRWVDGKRATPYIVAGSGGYAATKPRSGFPAPGKKVGDHTLEIAPIVEFGYLNVTATATDLTIAFKTVDIQTDVTTQRDAVSLDLKKGTIAPPSKLKRK